MAEPTLFDVEKYRVNVLSPVQPGRALTLGQRQAAKLAAGVHPLSGVAGAPTRLRLHVNAAPAGDKTAEGLRCDSCVHRLTVGHGPSDRPYTKCTWGWDPEDGGSPFRCAPRVNHSEASDCRAWWPACCDHEGEDETDV